MLDLIKREGKQSKSKQEKGFIQSFFFFIFWNEWFKEKNKY